ncbi:MAG TPA: hypothetical protein VGG72_24915 [Bryobacteraceae bacterium]
MQNNKNSTWKWNALAIAGAIATTVVPALAQDVRLKATIPFSFSINKESNLAPGNYIVTRNQNVWRFRSEDATRTVEIVNASGLQGQTAEQPALTFDCLGTHCQLRAIHMGGGALGAEVPPPQLSNADKAELGLVSVSLKPIKGK